MRDWIKELGVILAMPIVETDDGDDTDSHSTGTARPAQSRGSDGQATSKAAAGEKSNLIGLGPADAIGGLLPESRTTKIIIKNRSNKALQLIPGSAKVETSPAEFVTAPPLDIAANNGEAEFSISNALAGSIPAPVGTGGEVKYEIVDDDKKTQLFMKWECGFLFPSRKTTQTVTPKNEEKFKLTGFNSAGNDFAFVFESKGGAQPVPPIPPPQPSTDITASCQINVVNNTKVALKLAHQDHDRGDFMTNPATSLAAGASTAFAYVETPHPKDKDQRGCKGSLTWEVGAPATATWRVEWNNPVGEKNIASARIDPQSAGFESLEQIGQGDENVPITFTLSGGGGGDGPGPGPEPNKPEPEFNPPAGAREPTLRRGDKSPDGWVEYLQQLLNAHLNTNLKIDGDFGQSTLNAVIAFQKSQPGVKVDGIVGNQTWAALREGQPEKPSTDGRQPHSFEEKGIQARWFKEKDICIFNASKDEAEMVVNSVGEQSMEKFLATVRITRPNTKPKVVQVEIGPPVERTPDNQGNKHIVAIKNFRKTFMQGDTNDKVAKYLVEAYLPTEIGGDKCSGDILVISV